MVWMRGWMGIEVFVVGVGSLGVGVTALPRGRC